MQTTISRTAIITNLVRNSCIRNTIGVPRTFGSTACSHNSFKVQSLEDFNDRVKNSKTPVIVDFFATWCNPCRMLTPRLESVIAENKGKVVLAKVDIDEQSDLALDYEVASVPVLLAMKNGKVEGKLVGLQDVDKLRKFVENLLQDEEKLKTQAN